MTDQNEFRKPYEYEEETGVSGLLLLFFVMVLCFEILLGLTTLIQGMMVLRLTPWMSTVWLGFGCAYVLGIIFVCVALRKMFTYAIQLTKVFLWVRVVYLSLACLIIFIAVSKNLRIRESFVSDSYFFLSYLVIPFLYILSFSICWFWYFSKSKKVKEYQAMANRRSEKLPDGGTDQ